MRYILIAALLLSACAPVPEFFPKSESGYKASPSSRPCEQECRVPFVKFPF